jgi:hypothetical protein
MADFVSGADLVARGAEGTGAAVVLDNKPTIQNLARLGGRMDNLYKTQEMLKMKLAAAKAEKEKPPKQPNLNPFTTGGVIGDYIGSLGNQYMQTIAAIKGAKYNQKVSANDIAGANQEAADTASALNTINPIAQNMDRVAKNWFTENESFYKPTTQTALKIQSQFPTIDPAKLNALPNIEDKEKYITDTYNQFLQSDPPKIIRSATLGDPNTYNYNGVFQVIDKNLIDRNIDIQNADGTARATKASELFKKDLSKKYVELDYPKAISAIQNVPQANEQMEYLSAKAVKDSPIVSTEAFRALPEDQKNKKIADIIYKARQDYASNVFRTGLTYDQKADFEATRIKAENEAAGKTAAENLPPTSEGTMTFNVNRDVDIERPKLDASGKPIMKTINGKQFVDKEKVRTENFDYPVRSVGKTIVVKDFPLSNNQPFVFLSKQTPEDLLKIKAREYSPLGVKESVSYVSGLGSTASSATRVVGGLPMFLRAVQDIKDPNKTWYPGDFVPDYMFLAKKGRGGKPVDYLEKSDYFLPTGVVASPEITTPSLTGAPTTESTMQLFYPDETSQQKVFEALAEGKKQKSGDIFSKGKK